MTGLLLAFTLATYNIRHDVDKGDNAWTNRLPRIVQVVRSGRFDLIGFQEVRADMWQSFTNALGEYAFTDGGRSDDPLVYPNPIAYRPEQFDCLDDGLYSISERPEDQTCRSWESSSPRQWRWALLREKATGRKIRVYSIHPDWDSARARGEGMKVILAHAKGMKGLGSLGGLRSENVILLGDFNDAETDDIPWSKTNPAYPPGTSLRLARSVLKDVREISMGKHIGPDATANEYRPVGKYRLDYIFVSDGFTISGTRTHDDMPGGKFPSDHWAFSAQVGWKATAR